MPLDPRVAMGDLGHQDILALFNRLRLALSNQVCFDGSAKNHNWASITYGMFLFINCLGSLGVH